MTTPVFFRRLAQAEFDEAADWYERRQAGRGATFTTAVRRVLGRIAAAPDAFPEVYPDVREASVTGYPCVVYFQVAPDRVNVVAVFHTSRDPSAWQSRVGP